ncbi:hypothetical protein BCR37DRAFT_386701 [Protomyces lactucae-debilis]|uniref:Histone H1 n=1 Tax=Protomyces lactucae-debilis TaxID=2754530 RepID=A0A1Y2FLL8_PROLT|nr:uncharacterized protein BCR37DRAFT_386701 [Protomyces lactucae-debilis]ORY83665.1 hypothetical protein BCR37DRAFT_386701 [Protomyces lactucae-debilis]
MSFSPYGDYAPRPPTEQAQHGRAESQSGQGSNQANSTANVAQSSDGSGYAQPFMGAGGGGSGGSYNNGSFSASMNLSGQAQAFRHQMQQSSLGHNPYGAPSGHLSSDRDTQYNAYFDPTVANPMSMQGYNTHIGSSNGSVSTANTALYGGLSLNSPHSASMHSNGAPPQLQSHRSGSVGSNSDQQQQQADAAKYAYLQMQAAKHYGYDQSQNHGSTQPQSQPQLQGQAQMRVKQSPAVSQPPQQPQIPTPIIPALAAARPASSSTPPAAKKQKVVAKRGSGFSRKTEVKDENDSDEEYNMEGMKTKSGRKVHKPSQFNPSKQTSGRRRGGPPKKPVLDSLFCKVCERGHSPKSNMIVFCDGCNEPYHQLCHLPVIDNLLVTLPDAEWFCSACDEKRGHKPLEMGSDGADLTEVQKKTYLASLPTSHLVDIILAAARDAPHLKLFAPETRNILEEIHAKQEQAIAEERVRLLGQQYGPGDEYVPPVSAEDEACNVPGQPPMEQIVIRAIQTLAATNGSTTRDIIDWVDRNYSMPDGSYKMLVAQQIANCVRKGRLEQVKVADQTGFKINQEYRATVKVGPAALPFPAATSGGRVATRHAGETGVTAFSNEAQMYPPGSGIQLPPESAAEDGFAMVETESPVFTHRHG